MNLASLLTGLRVGALTALTGTFFATAIPAVMPAPSAHAQTGLVQVTTALNIRSTPSTSRPPIGLVYSGSALQIRGASRNGWTPVKYQGRDAWVASQYLALPSASAPGRAPVATGSMTTTAFLNVRTGPGLGHRVLTVLSKGTKVATTGTSQSGWTQIRYGSGSAWVSSRYVTRNASVAPQPTPPPKVSNPVTPPLPATIGSRWATLGLNLWLRDTGKEHLGEVRGNTELKITGKVSNGRAEVVHNGATRWVTAKFLATKPIGKAPRSGTCIASFYNEDEITATGEKYDPMGITAAHKTMPFNTMVKVTNVANGKSVVVRINDRGPYIKDRCLDLSEGAFQQIAPVSAGVIKVSYEII